LQQLYTIRKYTA